LHAYFFVIFLPLPKFSKVTCNITLSLFHIFKEQSSTKLGLSLFFSLQTWYSFTLTPNLYQVCV
jgi:hypothetical protein